VRVGAFVDILLLWREQEGKMKNDASLNWFEIVCTICINNALFETLFALDIALYCVIFFFLVLNRVTMPLPLSPTLFSCPNNQQYGGGNALENKTKIRKKKN
jgi:hypothetical protein